MFNAEKNESYQHCVLHYSNFARNNLQEIKSLINDMIIITTIDVRIIITSPFPIFLLLFATVCIYILEKGLGLDGIRKAEKTCLCVGGFVYVHIMFTILCACRNISITEQRSGSITHAITLRSPWAEKPFVC